MANYLTGVPDFLPTIQNFDPSLNFYAGVLATKQAQYNEGLKKVSIYGSVINSPMLAQDNIEKRDQYFKNVQQDIKKASQLDLSLDQNQQAVKQIFDPILNDKDIVNDIAITKKVHRAFQNGESYRNCSEPEKCGGAWWAPGEQALNYWVDEFRSATPENRLGMKAPNFVPYQNVFKDAMKAAKDSGLNTTYEYSDGKYNITETNGLMLLDHADKKGKVVKGILPQYLWGVFGNDPKYQEMFKTESYVERKNYVQQRMQYTGEDELTAEQAYFAEVLPPTTNKLEQSKADANAIQNKAEVDAKAAKILLTKATPGDGVAEAHAQLLQILDKNQKAVDNHEKVSNIMGTAKNLNDIRAMRSRVDSVVANAKIQQMVEAAAYEYAMGTAKRTIQVDHYGLAAFHNSLDLNKAIKLKEVDDYYFMKHEGFKHQLKQAGADDLIRAANEKNLWGKMTEFGIDRTNIAEPWARKKLLSEGILTGDQSEVSKPFASPTPPETPIDTDLQNSKITSQAIDYAHNMSSGYMDATAKGMATAYKDAATKPNGSVIQDKILSDAQQIWKGTGIDPYKILTGTATVDFHNNPRLGDMTARAIELRKQDKTGQVYNTGISEEAFMEAQKAQLVAKGLLNERTKATKEAFNQVLSSLPYDGNDQALTKEGLAYKALLTPEGRIASNMEQKDVFDAAVRYGVDAGKYYPGGGREAAQDFGNHFADYRENLIKKVRALDSRAGSQDEGGAYAAMNALTNNIDGNVKFASGYLTMQNLAREYQANPGSVAIDPTQIGLAGPVLTKLAAGDTKDLQITTQTQSLGDKVALRVIVDDKTAKAAWGLKPSVKPTEDQKTFVMTLPSESTIGSKFIPSPAEILLQSDGASIPIVLPGKGQFTILRDKGQLKGKVSALNYNYQNNAFDKDPKEIPIMFPEGTNPDIAFKQGKHMLDKYYDINQEQIARHKEQESKLAHAGR